MTAIKHNADMSIISIHIYLVSVVLGRRGKFGTYTVFGIQTHSECLMAEDVFWICLYLFLNNFLFPFRNHRHFQCNCFTSRDFPIWFILLDSVDDIFLAGACEYMCTYVRKNSVVFFLLRNTKQTKNKNLAMTN